MEQLTYKITSSLPQFHYERTLLVIAGTLHARIYIGYEGHLVLRDECIVEKPVFSDREGFISRMGRGQLLGRGAYYENTKERARGAFERALVAQITNIEREERIDAIALLAPDYVMSGFLKRIPQVMRMRITHTLQGNFTNHHPFDVLSRLSIS